MAARYFCDHCDVQLVAPARRHFVMYHTRNYNQVPPLDVENTKSFELCESCAADLLALCDAKAERKLVTDGENN